jgi:hypothetical protein
MNDTAYIGIFFVTLLCLVTLTPFTFLWVAQKNFIEPDVFQGDEGRNENSTPRTFILPATPAVAAEQERKLALEGHRKQIQGCIIALVDRGRKFSNVEKITSDDVFFETLRFQFVTNLDPTGEFDKNTRESLSC